MTQSMVTTDCAPVALGDGALSPQDFFAAVIEDMVCEKVNDLTFSPKTVGRRNKLTPATMRDCGRSQPRAMTRHFSAYILKFHPFSQGAHSLPSLGRRYGRDHTTIVSGLRRADNLILTRHAAATGVQAGLDVMAPLFGAFSLADCARERESALRDMPNVQRLKRKSR